MKVLSLLSIVLLSNIIPINQPKTNVEWYGQVLEQDTYLYRTPTNKIENNVYFIIEPTFFVKLIENANNLFYKVEYLDISGYVKKNEVQVVKNKPSNPSCGNASVPRQQRPRMVLCLS